MSPCPIFLFYVVVFFFFFRLPVLIGAQCNLATIYGLKTADCMNLDLTSVPRTLDSDLKTLNFHGNRLIYLDIDTFVAYPSLQNLYLVRNSLEAIAPDAFRDLQNLQILDLEGNKLMTIPGPAFAYTPSLRFLSLRSNPISYVTNEDFVFLKNVEVLNLENCWLKRIEPRAFGELSKLYELNLVNNELHGLNTEMAETLATGLAILRLHSNPWQCDCRLRWLRVLVSRVPNWDFGQNTPTCAGPELLRGVTWKQLVPDQFACPSTIVGNTTTIRELSVGANASIECVVSGDPQPSVTWMKGSRFVADDLISQNTLGEHDSKLVRSVVTLRDVSQADANDYKCIAVNTAGRSEVTYKVMVARSNDGGGGSGKHSPDAVAGMVLAPEMMLGVVVTSIGLVCGLLLCVTCAVMRVRARASSDRKLLDSRLKTVPDDDVGPSPTEDSFSSSGSECPSSPCGPRNSTAFDGTAVAVNEDNPTANTWTPHRNSLQSHCRISPADHPPPKPPIARQASLLEPDPAVSFQKEVCIPPVIPLEPEPKRVVVPTNEVPDDSVTPDLLSDKHVINFRNDRIADTDAVVERPSRMDGAARVDSRSSALAYDSKVRGEDRSVGVNSLNTKPKGEPKGEISESPRRQRAASVEIKSFCDNPVCLRERLSNSSSPGGVALGKGGGGTGSGGGERLLSVTGSVCSHRLALRKDIAQPSTLLSLAPGRPTPSPSSHRNRAYPRRSGVPSGFNHPTTSESCRDHQREHRRSNGAINHPSGQSYTLSRNHGASRIWASQQRCAENDFLGTTRDGRIVHGHSSKNESRRPPVFYLRASSGRLDREEDFEDSFPVTLNRRQTFSSMSLNEILSPPFGFSPQRQSGAFEAQKTRTASRRELEDQCGTAV